MSSMRPVVLWTTATHQKPHITHTTRHTPHITHHTSHITHHTSHVAHRTSHIAHHKSHITNRTSHITYHTLHITYHTYHILHITRHILHITCHTSQMYDVRQPIVFFSAMHIVIIGGATRLWTYIVPPRNINVISNGATLFSEVHVNGC